MIGLEEPYFDPIRFFGRAPSQSLRVALFVASPHSFVACGLSTAIAHADRFRKKCLIYIRIMEWPEIYHSIIRKWKEHEFYEEILGLQEAPLGSATGTEGLMNCIGFLHNVIIENPNAAAIIREELDQLQLLRPSGHMLS